MRHACVPDFGSAHRRACLTFNTLGEQTRQALMIHVGRSLNSTGVVDALTNLLIGRGPPWFNRSDNNPEFIAQ